MDQSFINTIMEIILWSAIVWASICYELAKNRGRNAWKGFFAGLVFGLLGAAYYTIAGDTVESRVKKEEDAYKKYEIEHKGE